MLSKGNKKMTCNIFNLPSGVTCKACLQCSKYCYAKKAERLYPQVMPFRKNNLKESKKKSFISKVVEILKARKNKIVRIHESGDFYSRNYVLKWYEIAKQLPEYSFYCYTKRDDVFTSDLLALRPKNMTINFSLDGIRESINQSEIDHALKIGFDNVAMTVKEKGNCPAIEKDQECLKDCRLCLSKNKVIKFKKH